MSDEDQDEAGFPGSQSGRSERGTGRRLRGAVAHYLGTAIVVDRSAFKGFAEDERNLLVLANATPGRPLKYLAGAGWSRAGEFTSRQAWLDYVAACAARLNSPVTVSIATAP